MISLPLHLLRLLLLRWEVNGEIMLTGLWTARNVESKGGDHRLGISTTGRFLRGRNRDGQGPKQIPDIVLEWEV